MSEQIKQNQFRAISLKQLKKGLWKHEYKIDTVVKVDDVLRVVEAHEKKLQDFEFLLKAEHDRIFSRYCQKDYTDAYYNGYLDAYEFAKEKFVEVLGESAKKEMRK